MLLSFYDDSWDRIFSKAKADEDLDKAYHKALLYGETDVALDTRDKSWFLELTYEMRARG